MLDKGALSVEITTEKDEKITLLIGATDKEGKSVYCQSNKAQGEVFTLPAAEWSKYRDKADIFAKD